MNTTIDLKNEVAAAVRDEWPVFAERHPRLARVTDETLMIDHAVDLISDDEEYRQAMATAAEVGAGMQVVADVVRRLVAKLIRTLP
jgi:hypothetical protein